MKDTINTKCNKYIEDDSIQFSRLITKIDLEGGFSNKLLLDLSNSMGLTISDIYEIIDRAKTKWNKVKAKFDK